MSDGPEDNLAEFIESIDDMIGRHFGRDARLEIQVIESDGKNWSAVEDILYRLIRSSITHARSQVAGRRLAIRACIGAAANQFHLPLLQ